MIWLFLILVALGLMFTKMGSYSVWIVVLSAALKVTGGVIAVLLLLLIWNKFFQRKSEPEIASKPKPLT